jgi:signal transduction histidine kinase
VNLADRITLTDSSLWLPRRTVRLRLTLLYGLLFLVSGAALLAITYVLVSSTGNGNVVPTVGSPMQQLKALLNPTPKPNSKSGLDVYAPPTTAAKARLLATFKAQTRTKLKAQAFATHAVDLHHLLTRSGIALGILAVLAVVLGWLVAGRVLRPLRTMTTATQRISEHNLHERLGLPGPSDEIKDLADTIDGLLQRLELAFDAQRRFVANASHELRTPLTLNRALLDVTLTNPDATVEDLRTMGEDLIASGEQQQQLIEALLTLATSARGLEQHEPFDLADITADVLRSPHTEFDKLDLDVQATITPAPATGDPRLAQRLVTNLLDNALRHNMAGGNLIVATRTESGHAILAVTNSGPIIPQDDIDRLFQPFQRLHNNRAYHANGHGHGHGHGLGLSIVQAIAAAHGATLDANALPEGGLHIEVRFPAAPVPNRRKGSLPVGPDKVPATALARRTRANRNGGIGT